MKPVKSELGQIEKNSVRVYVFRFGLELGHRSAHSGCLKGAINGSRVLFDHLVGAGEQEGRDSETERLCSLEVDHELELGRL
jgi:hypothetical protein